MKQWANLLTFWGAILAIIIGLISVVYYGIQIAILVPWLGPLWLMGAMGWIATVAFDIIAIICAFITWRFYYPQLKTNYKATGIPLIILGILSWAAVGGFLIFIAGILVMVDQEEAKA